MKPKLIPYCLFLFASTIVFAQNNKPIELNTGRAELTVAFNPESKIALNAACWHSVSQKVFVCAGDKGWFEPGGKRKRINVDVSASYKFCNWFYSDIEFNYSNEGLLGSLSDDIYISLQPSFELTSGLSAFLKNGFNASLRYDVTGDYPFYQFINFNGIKSLIKDIMFGYARKNFELAITAENIFIRKWKGSLFENNQKESYESIFPPGINYPTGTPRFIKTSLFFSF